MVADYWRDKEQMLVMEVKCRTKDQTMPLEQLDSGI